MIIGFIGVGVMGKSMVRNLMKNDYEVHIFARNKEKVLDVIEEGAIFEKSIKELSLKSDAIITIVGYPSDVMDVYFGDGKIMDSARENTILIDMTTSSPTLAKTIYEKGKQKNLIALDAPVTGGDIGAKNGTLTIFVGGDIEAYEKSLPILRSMGTTISYVGKSGSGQHAKLANQILIAGAVSAMAEAIAYAKKEGLDVESLVDVWASGSASSWQLKNMAPRALKNDFEPGFFIKHFIKDMKLSLEEANKMGLDLKMLNTVLEMFLQLERDNMGDLGTQAILKYYK